MRISITSSASGRTAGLAEAELKKYVEAVFEDTDFCSSPEDAEYVFRLRTKEPPFLQAEDQDPEDSQEFRIEPMEDPSSGMVITGGSEAALLWAVYELAEQWGVVFLHDEDVTPRKRPFRPFTGSLIRKPVVRYRTYMYAFTLAFGYESWDITEFERHISYLAKLKTNRIWLHTYPIYPLCPWSYKGIERSSWYLYFDMHMPLDENTVGRELFGSADEFYSPAIPKGADFAEATKAAQRLIHGIIDCAKRHGMEVILSVYPLEFNKEFAPLLKDVTVIKPFNAETVVPGAAVLPEDETLIGMARAYLEAVLDTYPEADYVTPVMPEFRDWYQHARMAYDKLDRKYGISRLRTYDEIMAQAESRIYSSNDPERNVKEAAGDLVALYFIDLLFHEYNAIDRNRHKNVKLLYSNVSEEMYPIFSAITEPGTDCYTYTDYSNEWMLDRKYLYGTQDPVTAYSCCITLHDDNVGFVPMINPGSSVKLMDAFIMHRCAGFYYRNWLISDQDITMYAIAHKAWDAGARAEQMMLAFAEGVYGEQCASQITGMFHEIESATVYLERYSLSFAFPVEHFMLVWHYSCEDPADEFLPVKMSYCRAKQWAGQALKASDCAAGSRIRYWLNRLEFGIRYMDCVRCVREAGQAARRNEHTAEAGWLQEALKAATEAGEAYARCAENGGDLGSIAVLNEYAVKEIRKLLGEAEKQPADVNSDSTGKEEL